jgi:hypothetical protein
MGHDWIIDVLADVRSFAQQNNLPLLDAHLDEAMLIASAEAANAQSQPANWQTAPPARRDTISGE